MQGLSFSSLNVFCSCPGFSWDRVNCLPSSWYSVMFQVQYEKNVDNTDVGCC